MTALLYSHRINAIIGESGFGKSILAQKLAKDKLDAGEAVGWLDYEDSPLGLKSRLLSIGCDADDVNGDLVTYIRPEMKWTSAAEATMRRYIEQYGITTLFVDSTGEALAAEGLNPNADEDVARWYVYFVRPLNRMVDDGLTIVLIDHVKKNNDGASLHAIGSQRKRAAIDGSMLRLDVKPENAYSRDKAGYGTLTVAKDRWGAHAQGKVVARMNVTPLGDGAMDVSITKPDTGDQALLREMSKTEQQHRDMELVSLYLANRKERMATMVEIVEALAPRDMTKTRAKEAVRSLKRGGNVLEVGRTPKQNVLMGAFVALEE